MNTIFLWIWITIGHSFQQLHREPDIIVRDDLPFVYLDDNIKAIASFSQNWVCSDARLPDKVKNQFQITEHECERHSKRSFYQGFFNILNEKIIEHDNLTVGYWSSRKVSLLYDHPLNNSKWFEVPNEFQLDSFFDMEELQQAVSQISQRIILTQKHSLQLIQFLQTVGINCTIISQHLYCLRSGNQPFTLWGISLEQFIDSCHSSNCTIEVQVGGKSSVIGVLALPLVPFISFFQNGRRNVRFTQQRMVLHKDSAWLWSVALFLVSAPGAVLIGVSVWFRMFPGLLYEKYEGVIINEVSFSTDRSIDSKPDQFQFEDDIQPQDI